MGAFACASGRSEWWDNRTFRLGDTMSVRLPSAEGYVAGVAKEQRWLPYLAPHLPLPVPVPLGAGKPGAGYPWSWSVNRWLDGENASPDSIGDLREFAVALARFLVALNGVNATAGPIGGEHSFYRGASLAHYDADTRRALDALRGVVDTVAATEVWERALGTTWQGPPVWFHGDVAVGNLLVKDGRLHAVIDFGTSGVGDPACDVVIAWTLLRGESRHTFRAMLGYDDATWERGRGWVVWKALVTIAGNMDTDPAAAAIAHVVLVEALNDDQRPTTNDQRR